MNVKRLVVVCTVMAMLFINCSIVMAAPEAKGNPGSQAVVEQVVKAINTKDWNTYVDLQAAANKADFKAFLNNEENKRENVGLFNITSATLKEIKALPLSAVETVARIADYKTQYNELAAYLAGIDYKVVKESKYHFNGVNYQMVILAKEAGMWRIVEMSDAPIEILSARGYGFGSSDEKAALEVIKARIQGKVVNKYGVELEHNKATSEELKAEMENASAENVAAVAGDHSRPSTIRVYRVGLKKSEKIAFNTYIKNVLPNEWISSWPAESLKAGAMASKMYGWYHVYHPKWPSLGADVKDTTADQVYKPGSAITSTTNAVNAVAGVGLQNSAGHIFEAQYLAGTSGVPGTAHSGKIMQWGTKYWANQGKNYLYMCHYYYDTSDKSSGAVSTFSYK